MICRVLSEGNELINSGSRYEDIFSQNLNDQVSTTILLQQKLLKRKQMELNYTKLKSNWAQTEPDYIFCVSALQLNTF